MRNYLPLKIHVIVFDQVPIFMLLSRNIILFLVCIIGLGTMVLFRNFLEVISYFKKYFTINLWKMIKSLSNQSSKIIMLNDDLNNIDLVVLPNQICFTQWIKMIKLEIPNWSSLEQFRCIYIDDFCLFGLLILLSLLIMNIQSL